MESAKAASAAFLLPIPLQALFYNRSSNNQCHSEFLMAAKI
jgi:hypothetical protein